MTDLNEQDPKISIIIPVFKPKDLQAILRHINQQSSLKQIKEVFVVGQMEDVPKFSERSIYRYIPVTDNPTASKNRNIGASLASSDWLCFVDSDCLPGKKWIEEFHITNDNQGSIIAGSVDLPSSMSYWSWCDHLLGFGDQVYGVFSGRKLKYCASLNLIIRKSFFLEIGGFDESFTTTGEDLDFSYRSAQKNQSILFLPRAVCSHNHGRSTFNSAWIHLFRYGEGTVRLRLKNKNDWTSFQRIGYSLLKIYIIGELIGLLRVLIRALIRPIIRPRILKYWKYLPGIFILDLAHTKGLIYNFRVYHSTSNHSGFR